MTARSQQSDTSAFNFCMCFCWLRAGITENKKTYRNQRLKYQTVGYGLSLLKTKRHTEMFLFSVMTARSQQSDTSAFDFCMSFCFQ
jgi:hypothetical protein